MGITIEKVLRKETVVAKVTPEIRDWIIELSVKHDVSMSWVIHSLLVYAKQKYNVEAGYDERTG